MFIRDQMPDSFWEYRDAFQPFFWALSAEDLDLFMRGA